MTKDEIVKFLEKELSYDGTADKECPKCGHILSGGDIWIDHYSSLAGNLAVKMGFRGFYNNPIKEPLEQIFKDFMPSGNEKEDAEGLAEIIMRDIYGVE